ncbi:MAG TPA: AI-2E family transporter [Thermoanaerobaculia bacterium]|jgi:predicted PurR-regulated permease PerM|nr:AI-2E family transporter [Thermoanaerobaculia bacterium]
MTNDRATGVEKAAYLLTAFAILFVFHFGLVAGLLAGLLVHTALHRTARFFHGPKLSHGAARWLATGVVGLVSLVLTTLVVILFIGFLRGSVGDLSSLFAKVADTLETTRGLLRSWGLGDLVPSTLQSAEDLQTGLSEWFREHAAEVRHAGGEAGHLLLHCVMGIVVGLLVFFRHRGEAVRPLAEAFSERIRRLAGAFEAVMLAQVEISAVNTVLTAVYLFGILPLLGYRLPLSGTVLIVTFVAGLIPVAGNLVSNTVIVVLSLGVSPWIGLASLAFLVTVHKLEYFLNAKIVGGRINAQAWEILLAIVVFEVAFGIPGVVLAPVLYAYIKRELADRELV